MIFDIHSHILPEVDDGAWDMQESLEMIRTAASCGVSTLIATPHCIPGKFENYNTISLRNQFSMLRSSVRAEGIPVEILSGMEVFVTDQLPDQLDRRQVLTLNDTSYLLVEFDFDEPFFWCTKMLKKVLERNYIPVIAHPERYFAVYHEPWKVEEWLEMGCHIQLNKGSVLGRFGREIRRAADYLMRNDMAACIASDAHSTYQRTTVMSELYRYLTETYSKEYADMVLCDNPRKICQGQKL